VELVGVVLGELELPAADALAPVFAIALPLGVDWPPDPHPAIRETPANKIKSFQWLFIAILL
jgi:hypothetical protein